MVVKEKMMVMVLIKMSGVGEVWWCWYRLRVRERKEKRVGEGKGQQKIKSGREDGCEEVNCDVDIVLKNIDREVIRVVIVIGS